MAIEVLNSSFMAASIIGLIISVIYIPKFSMTWAVAFGLLFAIMLFASILSLIKGDSET